MYLLNLLILVLILINLGLCSYGLYNKTTSEKYEDPEGPGYKEAIMKQFEESKNENYEDQPVNADDLINKFNSEGENYEDTQDTVKQNLSSLYGE
jgi:hypothetical protein